MAEQLDPTGPVIGVSWPRSGHHMLVRLLQLYFGPDLGYCDFYGGKPWVDEIETCCKQIPCMHAERIWLTKNHDFELNLPQIPNQKYLIQYRDFAPSVVSNFELFVRNGGEDSALAFRKFASGEFTRYLGFVERWVTSEFAAGQLHLNYSVFLSNPQNELSRAVAFLKPDIPVDADRIASAIADVDGEEIKQGRVKSLRKSGVHPERALRDFRHFSPALERELNNMHLSRPAVMETFDSILGRAPAESNVLRFQGFKTREALAEELMDTDEYRILQQRAAHAAPPKGDA